MMNNNREPFFDGSFLEVILKEFPELYGKKLKVEPGDFGRDYILTMEGSDPVVVNTLEYALLTEDRRQEYLCLCVEKFAHGSFEKLIDKYNALVCEHNGVKEENEKHKEVTNKLEKEVLKLETLVENWKELYEAERNRSSDIQWADDAKNGRLQGEI